MHGPMRKSDDPLNSVHLGVFICPNPACDWPDLDLNKWVWTRFLYDGLGLGFYLKPARPARLLGPLGTVFILFFVN